jgi:hypothetical protein
MRRCAEEREDLEEDGIDALIIEGGGQVRGAGIRIRTSVA